MRMNAVLSNPKHPEYGQFTVPLPIPHNQYDGIMEALNAMDMGDPLARDCQMDEILGEYPILKRLEGKPVNIDELDYLPSGWTASVMHRRALSSRVRRSAMTIPT